MGWFTVATGGTQITTESIVPNSDATYFARWTEEVSETFYVNALAYPAYGGSVSGGGYFLYGEYVTLTAVPNNDFHFLGWRRLTGFISRDYELTLQAGVHAGVAGLTQVKYSVVSGAFLFYSITKSSLNSTIRARMDKDHLQSYTSRFFIYRT